MSRVALFVIVVCLALAACDRRSPPEPPVVTPTPAPGQPEAITGSERLGWQQAAADAVELATFRYAIYVDGVRSELAGATCTRAATDFSCTARLPSMPAGAHTLQLATFIVDGSALESARSRALQVTVTPSAGAAERPAPWPTEIVTADGVRLRLERFAGGVADPTDFAFAPDGRLFVAEREGRVRVLDNGRLLGEPAPSLRIGETGSEQLLALATDPQFDRTHFVYAIYTTTADSGDATFSLARFREAANTLADRVILLDGVRAAAVGAAAALRFGADGKLFAALDDGGNRGVGGDLASPNGKVLRLNPDGTTPADQAAGSPVYSYPYRSPVALDFHPASGLLWIADRDSVSSGRLSAVEPNGTSRQRGVFRTAHRLPEGSVPSSLAFYRGGPAAPFKGNLLIASENGRHLLRVTFDPLVPTRVLGTERLLQDVVGGVRLVTVGPDGAIYLATDRAIGRLR